MATRRIEAIQKSKILFEKMKLRVEASQAVRIRLNKEKDLTGGPLANLFGLKSYDFLIKLHDQEINDEISAQLRALSGPHGYAMMKAMQAKHSNPKNRKRKRK